MMRKIEVYRKAVEGKSGLEIGGPSQIFQEKNLLPIYPVIKMLDGCNYAKSTLWEGEITEGTTYLFDKKKEKGHQYICDSVQLKFAASGQYDFVLASHVMEHIANPLKAGREWVRVLKDRGVLIVVVPSGDKFFDHARPLTFLEHLIEDLEKDVGEDDLSHLPEILSKHDIALDPGAGHFEAFRQRSLDNFHNRCLHHHVYDMKLVRAIFEFLNLQIIGTDVVLGNIIVMGRKIVRDANEK